MSAVQSRMVRYHPPIGLSTLFRPLPKRGERQTLNVEYAIPKEKTVLRFSARCALGIPEQTLLLVLLELAEARYLADPDGCRVDARSQVPMGRALWVTAEDFIAPQLSRKELLRRGIRKVMDDPETRHLVTPALWDADLQVQEAFLTLYNDLSGSDLFG